MAQEQQKEISLGFRLFLLSIEVIFLIAVLVGAWFLDKTLLAPPLIVAFRLTRIKIEEKHAVFHCATVSACICISTLICWFGLYLSLPIGISLISNIIVGVIFAIITWKIQEVIDMKAEYNELKTKLENKSNFNVDTCTEEELIARCKELRFNEENTLLAIELFIKKTKQSKLADKFFVEEHAISTLGYQNQAGFNALGSQLASCCCDIRTELMQNRYLNEKQTCDIVNASNANTRAILDYLTGEKISALQAENSGLKAQISNDRQSAYLLNELKPCPIPAYLTCNPNAPYGLGYGAGYGFNTFNGTCCGASVQ